MKLAVPHYRQSQSHTCLPACVRMVLAYNLDQELQLDLITFLRDWSALGQQGLVIWT